jgi:anti-anti-sigma factor
VLRITVKDSETATTMRLEGNLAGPEVKELTTCWLAAVTTNPCKSIVVDLKEVRFIDRAGKELLVEMRSCGVKFVGVDYWTQNIVEGVGG